MEKINRYTPKEVLAIFRANYLQQEQVSPDYAEEQLTFDITIEEWIDICDLREPYELSDYFNYFFDLDFSMETWLHLMQPVNNKTLGELCNFISEEAFKPLILPVNIFGSDCQNAAIFKYLMSKFEKKGIDTKAIKPSSPLEPFAKKNLGVLIEETNKLSPSALPPIDYKPNFFYSIGTKLFLAGFFSMIASIWISNLIWVIVSTFSAGVLMCWIGSRFDPAKASFKELDTFRDLVIRIEQNSKVYV